MEDFPLDINEVSKVVEKNYNLDIVQIEKVKNVYKITTKNDLLCLKVIKYELAHFLFILGVIKHLQYKGFETIPEIIATNSGEAYIKLEKSHGYLTKWIAARESNYDNPVDLKIAALKLADFHIKSRGFKVENFMKPRIGWLRWIENFKRRKEEILDFKRIIYEKNIHTDFDVLYIDNMKEELDRCDKAISNLSNSNYYQKMKDEIKNKGFCHHDFAHHNVLIDKNEGVNLIDFDYTILDTHLHDLSSFLIRRMKNGKWDINNCLYLLDIYSSIYRIEESDIQIMAGFMEFPQDYWQVGIQYYWEKQPWEEDFFLKKLGRIYEDREEKQEFVDEFRKLKYKG